MSRKKVTTPVVTENKTEALAAELGLDTLAPTPIETVETVAQEATPVEGVEATAPAKKSAIANAFRKMAPNINVAPIGKVRAKPEYKAVDKQKGYEVSGNASLMTFPTDRYGITKDIKKAMIATASRIAGDQAKKDLVLEVVTMLTKHIEIKFAADQAYRKKLSARTEVK